jgi:hypothetical protein
MFANVFESLQKATEANLQFQQETYRKLMTMWPGTPTSFAVGPEKVRELQKKWGEFISNLLKQQGEFTETQFKAGLQNIEKFFELGEVKAPDELRAKCVELWQKCFESLGQAYQAQITDFQKAMGKWFELVTKP